MGQEIISLSENIIFILIYCCCFVSFRVFHSCFMYGCFIYFCCCIQNVPLRANIFGLWYPAFFVVADQFGKKYCFSVILICRLIDHTTTTS